jgi:protein-disulfide isomerase
MKRIIASLVLTSLLLLPSQTKAESLDQVGDDVFEKKVLEVIRKNPEFIEKTMIIYADKKRKEQEAQQFSEIINNRVEVDYGKSPTQGKKDAKYQLVIFTDFECPYCKKGEATVQKLKEKLGDDLFIVQKNYPLAFHKNAKSAALAALAAHQQGKFFEYSEKLFANQRELSEDLYINLAKDLKLDLKKFKEDMKSKTTMQLLEEDLKAADKVKVSSTPNFILNGIKIAGAYPIDYFEKIIGIIDLEE